jgi:hypothetical protein
MHFCISLKALFLCLPVLLGSFISVYISIRSWTSSANIMTELRARRSSLRGLVPGLDKALPLLHRIRTASGAHPVPYPVTGPVSSRINDRNMNLSTRLHLVSKFRVLVAIRHLITVLN